MEIKNCPFCGSEVELKKLPLWNGSHGYYGCYEYVISCDNCGCRKHLGNNNTVYNTDEEAKKNALDSWNMRTEALKAEPCDTLKLDGMLEDAYEHGYQQAKYDYETQLCEDAVSREAVLDIFDAYEAAELDHHVPRMLYSRVIKLPSVQPERAKCADCKFYQQGTFDGFCIRYRWFNPKEDWYCADFEG